MQRLGVDEPIEFASYNMAPSQAVPIIRVNNGTRQCTLVRWGLVPFWANGKPMKANTINARAESMRSAPSFRDAWRRGRRCLFPALGFYEWQAVEGQKVKQPWFIKSKGDDLLVMAGLWEQSPSDEGTLESATIITVPSNELMTEIHQPKNRMPLILGEDEWAQWLNGGDADTLVRTQPDGLLDAWPVSTYINKPENDDLRCMERSRRWVEPQASLF